MVGGDSREPKLINAMRYLRLFSALLESKRGLGNFSSWLYASYYEACGTPLVALRCPRHALSIGALGMDIYVSQLGNKLVISGQVLRGATQMDLRGYGSYTTMCEMCVNVGY